MVYKWNWNFVTNCWIPSTKQFLMFCHVYFYHNYGFSAFQNYNFVVPWGTISIWSLHVNVNVSFRRRNNLPTLYMYCLIGGFSICFSFKNNFRKKIVVLLKDHFKKFLWVSFFKLQSKLWKNVNSYKNVHYR